MSQDSRSTIHIRFYAELNDFLPAARKFNRFEAPVSGHQTIKDVIEAQGVPHTEVDLIIVNGISVGFDYRVQDNDSVSVYPVFESIDIEAVNRLRPKPLREPRFVVDINLGRLARYLRMLGFDTTYRNDLADKEIVDISENEHRIILTRDQDLLKHKRVTHGYWVRSTKIGDQIREVVHRFDLRDQLQPFRRCMVCNGLLHPVSKEDIIDELKEGTRRDHDTFYRCGGCGKIYWKGSHYEKMKKIVRDL